MGYLSYGQNCDYLTSRYDVTIDGDVFYGIAETFDGSQDSLFMNIYKPKNDFNEDRPLIIWCFGGGFFTGQKEDFNAICNDMASRGYVAVTIDYRLGYVRPNSLGYPFAYDEKELLRAGYRAMQDAKGAIRFLKDRKSTDSIDIDNVFIGGASAGAITALAATFVDREGEVSADITSDLGMTNTTPSYERGDLGDFEGSLNLGQHDSQVKGVVNIFGAVFDTAQIAKSQTAVFSYHQAGDPIVPCDYKKAYWGIPFVSQTMPFGYGSCSIDEHLSNLSYDSNKYETIIYQGNQHATHNELEVLEASYVFLEKQICEMTTSVSVDMNVKEYRVHPNPASDRLTIENVNASSGVSIFDVYGRQAAYYHVEGNEVNIENLRPGLYFLKIESALKAIPFLKH
jgi:acetyl esterase/lipase